MRSEVWKILCCTAAASVLFGMAGCRANGINADVKEPDIGPAVIMISAKDEEPSGSSAALPESGIINGLYYHIIPACSNGVSGKRGYYVIQDKTDKLPYKICIAAGKFTTGGHDIKVTDIQFDGSKLTVTVMETSPAPEDVVTEAFTYPCCALETDKLPETISVVTQKGDAFERIDTQLDGSEIDKGWFCVFEDGAGEMMRQTYVYELPDGRYKFINVQSVTASWGSSKWKHVVKGTGTVDSREAIVEEAKKFKSCGFIMYAGDTVKKPHSVAEFLIEKK
ncbi:MAG: protease complex subunit PrcB family protein [Saccharofermentans sp.]|nr:protease complex subunit PrcB family protein [Saccharofermentans sp.]